MNTKPETEFEETQIASELNQNIPDICEQKNCIKTRLLIVGKKVVLFCDSE